MLFLQNKRFQKKNLDVNLIHKSDQQFLVPLADSSHRQLFYWSFTMPAAAGITGTNHDSWSHHPKSSWMPETA
jgi:hypothetical protein